jgi:hypothetical protein
MDSRRHPMKASASESVSREFAVLSLLGGWFVFFGRAIFTSGLPFYRDVLVTHIPMRQFVSERLRSGNLPQWYPYESLGVPFIGQLVTATFHPLSLLLLPLDAAVAVKWTILLSSLLALGGAYLLCRATLVSRLGSLVGAYAYALGGYAASKADNPTYLLGLATLPWLGVASARLLRTQRDRDMAWVAAATSLLFLSGDAQTFLLSPLLILLLMAIEGWSLQGGLKLLGGGALGVMLSCVELLPALAVGRASTRYLGVRTHEHWALHPLRLLGLLIADLVPDQHREAILQKLGESSTMLWANSVAAGATVLVLAAVAASTRRKKPTLFAALALFTLWLALGGRGGLLPVLSTVLPTLKGFLYPEKYLVFTWLGLSLLAAVGTDEIVGRLAGRAWVPFAVAGGLCVVAAVMLAPLDLVGRIWNLAGHPLDAGDGEIKAAMISSWSSGLLTGAAALWASAGGLWIARTRPRFSLVVPAIVFLELLNANGDQLPLMPGDAFDRQPSFVTAYQKAVGGPAPPGRVVNTFQGPQLTLGTGASWARAVLVALSADLSGVFHIPASGKNLPAWAFRYSLLLGDHETMRRSQFLNGCFATTDLGAGPAGGQLLETAGAEGASLYQISCGPRAFLTGATPAASLEEAKAGVAQGLNMKNVVWEGGPAVPRTDGEVEWVSYEPEQLQLDVRAADTTALVVSDLYAEGWHAAVDGEEVPIYATDLALRGLVVPAGKHHVSMRYRTPGLVLGGALSALGLLLVLALLLLPRRLAAQSSVAGVVG